MIGFYQDNTTLYPDSWNYNATLIMEELEKIVLNNGGIVKKSREGYIVNGSLMRCVQELETRIKRMEEAEETTDEKKLHLRETYIKNCRKEIEELNTIKNDPIKVSHTGYMSFILDGIYYSVSLDDNPFFDHHYVKTPIQDGKISRDAGCENLSHDFIWDCFFSVKKPATDDDRREVANMIFNYLLTADNSEIIRDKKKVRVSNRYNSGYHYETIYSPERFEKIDFSEFEIDIEEAFHEGIMITSVNIKDLATMPETTTETATHTA